MTALKNLRILFATNFSDASFRTGRAIAQLGHRFRLDLTIAHVVRPGRASIAARRELSSFLAEADHFDSCRRTLIESDCPADSIAGLTRTGSFDLVMAPASDRIGLSRRIIPSFRAKLMRLAEAPLWTIGPALDHLDFHAAMDTVACVMDFERGADESLRLASAFSASVGARLRIIGIVPPVSEGDLIHPDDNPTPLAAATAVERIHAALQGISTPDVDVVIGSQWRHVARLLSDSQASVAFLCPSQALIPEWIPRLRSHVDRLPCPAICVDGAASRFDRWTFERDRDWFAELQTETETVLARVG